VAPGLSQVNGVVMLEVEHDHDVYVLIDLKEQPS